jgi:hypothetical protein
MQISCYFRWFRVPVEGEEEAIRESGGVYTVTADDVGCSIKVVRSSSVPRTAPSRQASRACGFRHCILAFLTLQQTKCRTKRSASSF